MFSGRRKNRRKDDQGSSNQSESNRTEIIEEIDMNDIKLDSMRSRISNTEKTNTHSEFTEDIDRIYSRGQSGSIGDVIDDKPKLQRGLKARHVSYFPFNFCQNFLLKKKILSKINQLTMISLGGTIGTGLFLASGASIANAGPGGALIAYSLIGIMVFFMMECLGEMVMKSILTL